MDKHAEKIFWLGYSLYSTYLQLVGPLIGEQLQQNGNKACRDNHISSYLEADNKRQERKHCVQEILWVWDYTKPKEKKPRVSLQIVITPLMISYDFTIITVQSRHNLAQSIKENSVASRRIDCSQYIGLLSPQMSKSIQSK